MRTVELFANFMENGETIFGVLLHGVKTRRFLYVQEEGGKERKFKISLKETKICDGADSVFYAVFPDAEIREIEIPSWIDDLDEDSRFNKFTDEIIMREVTSISNSLREYIANNL